jgi:hypothetical protein
MAYDLKVKAKTPGQPDVLLAANVTAAAADKLVQRLRKHNLLVEFEITGHRSGVTVDNFNDRNPAHVEVLLAVLERREAAAVVVPSV